MTFLRSLAFVACFYVWSTAVALAMLPLLLAPPTWMLAVVSWWARGTIVLVRAICGVRVEVRGAERLADGAALVAAKHQGMFDTIAPLAGLPQLCYVLKQELLRIPIYGLFCRKTGMIALDRGGGSRALRGLVAQARQRLAQGRQVVIFPEGTRMAPGARGDYKPGVAALYRDLGVACTPMATNSGRHWPAHGFLRRPGLVVYEFLPPIEPGLPRAAFMRTLEERIEGASQALLAL